MAEYVSNESIARYLSQLHTYTASSLRKSQKWHVPYVITNTINQVYLSTYDERDGIDAITLDGKKVFKNIKAIYINEDIASTYKNNDVIDAKVYYMSKKDQIKTRYADIIGDGEVFAILEDGTIIRDVFGNLKYYKFTHEGIEHEGFDVEIGEDQIDAIAEDGRVFYNIFNLENVKFNELMTHTKFNIEFGEGLNAITDDDRIIYDVLNLNYIKFLRRIDEAKFNIQFLESDTSLKLQINRRANINVVDKFRYDGKYYAHRYSVNDPDSAIGILQVDNLPYNSFSNRINKKCFYGRLDRLVYQGLMKPLMVFVDHKFVKWDDIDIVYDSDESWIVLHGEKYAKEYIIDKEINIVIMPFKCEYIGEETDYSFNANYEALTNYLQDNCYIDSNNELYLNIPTMETVYKYNQYPVNVGGWMYYQIKRYHLGLLSEDRIKKLRYIPVFKYLRDSGGSILSTKQTRFNALDRDSYTSEDLYAYLNYMELEHYNKFTKLSFTNDGLYDTENGEYSVYITNESTQVHIHDSSDDLIYCDLSDINNVLFRENYLVFDNGYFKSEAKIMTSINNIIMMDNPDKHKMSIIGVYDKHSAHVIRNTDNFLKSYMNDKAKKYLEVLYYHNYETETALDAITTDNLAYKNIDAYFLDKEFAFVPKLTDYIVYLNDQNTDLVNFVHKALDPFDFTIDKKLTIEESNKKAIDVILDYNPSLLNGAYTTYIDSREFTGSQANDNLVYTFMYQSKRGLKIPRKKYKNHETYMMVFLNGELFENYYKTIAYANFFFIPVDDDFSFKESDRIEVLYFKNVNNNEIRFSFTEWIYNTLLSQSKENSNYYNIDIFSNFIRPEELQIFCHYPKYLIQYPTLIPEASENIAFNISSHETDNTLAIKNSAIYHITDGYEPLNALDMSDYSTTYHDIQIGGTDMPITLTTDDINVIDVLTGEDLSAIYTTEQLENTFVATSKYKFVYQRLYVDKKSYRIALDKRFRYCDNQRQYILFINGRRMKQDSYLVTIPKHTRPFYGLYLYTARFVDANDRVELFYVPYEMTDINIDNKPRCEVKPSGYLDYLKTDLDVPLSKDLYLFFVNGKKIPYNDIADIDSHTVRFTTDINTLKYPAVTPINVGNIKQVSDNLRDENKISKYDSLVNFIRTHSAIGYEELDNVFGYYAKMTDTEEDKVWANVAHIAILNEIVRDFWVTSGYNYQDQTFIYDYETDELYEEDKDTGTLILPALDATPVINIEKNITSLLYFYTEPRNLLFEKGSVAESFKFYWDYSQRINQELDLISQSINGVEIPLEDREYEWIETIEEPRNFRFVADTGFRILVEDTKLDFVNGVYWGTIDEDSLQYYNIKHNLVYLNEIVAIVPKDGYTIKSSIDQYKESGEITYQAQIIDQNNIIRNIWYDESNVISGSPLDIANIHRLGNYIESVHARVDDTGKVIYDIVLIDPQTLVRQYLTLDAEELYDSQGRKIIDYLPYIDVYNGEEIFAVTIPKFEGDTSSGRIFHDIFGQIIYHRAIDSTNINIVNVYSDNFIAVLDDAENEEDKTKWRSLTYQLVNHTIDNPELYSKEPFDTWHVVDDTMLKREMNRIREYYDQSDLHQLMHHLDKHLIRTADIQLNDYIIGNNKYFVFACAKELLYENHVPLYAEFSFPDLQSEEILSNCRDDKTTPVYTNGHFIKETKLLKEIKEMHMEFMGEFPYKNEYGYTTTFVMWKTNGFFTRLFETYGFDIHIKIGDLSKVNFNVDNKTSTSVINYTENNAISSAIIPKRKSLSLNIPMPKTTTSEGEDDNMAETNNNVNRTDIINEAINNAEKDIGVELIDNVTSSNNGLSDKKIKELLDQGIYLI